MLQDDLLRLPAVVARVGYGRSTLYMLIKKGRFPAPIALGPRARAWPSSSIDNWIQEKIKQAHDHPTQPAPPVPVKRRKRREQTTEPSLA